MATAQTLITRALRLLSVVGSGVTPDSNALADGLTALNSMLSRWRTEGLVCYDNTSGNWVQFNSFASLSSSAIFQDGYDEAIAFNLAATLSAEFGVEPSAYVASNATKTLQLISRQNYETIAVSISGTAQALISRSMRLIGAVKPGANPKQAELNIGLTALNAMLEGWRNQPWASWSIDEVTGGIVANQQSYTLGPAGNINTTRPINIENARFQLSGVDYPLQIIDQAQWAGIRVKGLKSNIPRYIYPTGDYPMVTLNLWPIPTQTATLILGVVHPLSGISALGDTVSLPPGYEQAIAYNLAICLAPEFGVSASGEVVQIAKKSLAEIKRMNSQTITADLGLLAGRKYNIYADF